MLWDGDEFIKLSSSVPGYPDTSDPNYQNGTLDERYLSLAADAGAQTVQSTGTTTFDSCGFVQWDLVYRNSTPAIVQNSGSLLLNGNEFQSPGVQLHIGPAAHKTIVSSNIGVGALNITGSKAKAVIVNNAFDSGGDSSGDYGGGQQQLRERLLSLDALLDEGVISQVEHGAARRSALGIIG